VIKSKTKWARHVTHRRDKNAYKIFIRKPEGKRLLGRPRRRWEDNIKMCLKEKRI
jgi:hypothetical protein